MYRDVFAQPGFDWKTGGLEVPEPVLLERHDAYTSMFMANPAILKELRSPKVKLKKRYQRIPEVRPDARVLHEDLAAKAVPDTPIPMPSEHLIEFVFETASVNSRKRPRSLRTLHPTALLATTMASNEYIMNLLSPLVLDHVKRCLDDEEEEIRLGKRRAFPEPLKNIPVSREEHELRSLYYENDLHYSVRNWVEEWEAVAPEEEPNYTRRTSHLDRLVGSAFHQSMPNNTEDMETVDYIPEGDREESGEEGYSSDNSDKRELSRRRHSKKQRRVRDPSAPKLVRGSYQKRKKKDKPPKPPKRKYVRVDPNAPKQPRRKYSRRLDLGQDEDSSLDGSEDDLMRSLQRRIAVKRSAARRSTARKHGRPRARVLEGGTRKYKPRNKKSVEVSDGEDDGESARTGSKTSKTGSGTIPAGFSRTVAVKQEKRRAKMAAKFDPKRAYEILDDDDESIDDLLSVSGSGSEQHVSDRNKVLKNEDEEVSNDSKEDKDDQSEDEVEESQDDDVEESQDEDEDEDQNGDQDEEQEVQQSEGEQAKDIEGSETSEEYVSVSEDEVEGHQEEEEEYESEAGEEEKVRPMEVDSMVVDVPEGGGGDSELDISDSDSDL